MLVTALAVVTMFRFTPHHSYYGCGFALRWVFIRSDTVIVNNFTSKSVPAGTKLVLFGR